MSSSACQGLKIVLCDGGDICARIDKSLHKIYLITNACIVPCVARLWNPKLEAHVSNIDLNDEKQIVFSEGDLLIRCKPEDISSLAVLLEQDFNQQPIDPNQEKALVDALKEGLDIDLAIEVCNRLRAFKQRFSNTLIKELLDCITSDKTNAISRKIIIKLVEQIQQSGQDLPKGSLEKLVNILIDESTDDLSIQLQRITFQIDPSQDPLDDEFLKTLVKAITNPETHVVVKSHLSRIFAHCNKYKDHIHLLTLIIDDPNTKGEVKELAIGAIHDMLLVDIVISNEVWLMFIDQLKYPDISGNVRDKIWSCFETAVFRNKTLTPSTILKFFKLLEHEMRESNYESFCHTAYHIKKMIRETELLNNDHVDHIISQMHDGPQEFYCCLWDYLESGGKLNPQQEVAVIRIIQSPAASVNSKFDALAIVKRIWQLGHVFSSESVDAVANLFVCPNTLDEVNRILNRMEAVSDCNYMRMIISLLHLFHSTDKSKELKDKALKAYRRILDPDCNFKELYRKHASYTVVEGCIEGDSRFSSVLSALLEEESSP